jgi:hypothetical protein
MHFMIFKKAEHKFYANWWSFTQLDRRKHLAAFQVAHRLSACLWKRHLRAARDKRQCRTHALLLCKTLFCALCIGQVHNFVNIKKRNKR